MPGESSNNESGNKAVSGWLIGIATAVGVSIFGGIGMVWYSQYVVGPSDDLAEFKAQVVLDNANLATRLAEMVREESENHTATNSRITGVQSELSRIRGLIEERQPVELEHMKKRLDAQEALHRDLQHMMNSLLQRRESVSEQDITRLAAAITSVETRVVEKIDGYILVDRQQMRDFSERLRRIENDMNQRGNRSGSASRMANTFEGPPEPPSIEFSVIETQRKGRETE